MIRSTSIPINELTNANKTTGRIVLSFRWSEKISLVAAVIVPTKACHLVVARASTGERPARTKAGTLLSYPHQLRYRLNLRQSNSGQ